MKKKIVLIDLDLSISESILESEKVNIEYLITDADSAYSNKKIDDLKSSHKIKNVISREKFHEFTEQRATDLDYKSIEQFRESQLNSEYFQSRFSNDFSLKQYHYFNALSFWIDIFTNENICAIILEGRQHGANYDGLALDVAKAYKVPSFVFETYMVRHAEDATKSVRAVLDYGLKNRIPIDHSKLNLQKVDLKNYLFYYEKIDAETKKKRKSFKDILKLLLPSYLFIAIRMIVKIITNKKIVMHGLITSPAKVLQNIFYIIMIKRKYDSISVNLDTSKKYVVYALHFDPEASIMSRTVLNNQLLIIKQLSESLPDGWLLYVKEHPIQFKAFVPGHWFYLISFEKYRTINFYQEVLKFTNVRFLNGNVSSPEIIKSATAIASINGTIACEAITHNLPMILFGHESNPFGSCSDLFKIKSSKQCREALKIIESDFRPSYSDAAEIVNKELFELNINKKNDVKYLIDYMVCEYDKTNPFNS